MLQERKAIPIGEAIQKVMADDRMQPIETTSLTACKGRFLAEDIIANQDVPAFNRALYDGYALRAEDTNQEHPTIFEVVGEIGAGSVFSDDVQEYQAVRIMTGAEVPSTCNAVVMLEHVEEYEEEERKYIKVHQSIPAGDRILQKGAEIRLGSCLVTKGTRITPGVIGLLATFGIHQVPVKKRPVVGVLATGSELLEVDQPLVPGKIRNSNSYMLLAQIEQAGGEPVYLGKLEDDLDKSVEVVQEALQRVDILITTGGVSVGDYDYLPDVYERLGADVLFNKIAMRPGSVTTVAKIGNHYLFGLSGNPSASFIGFELFVRPLLRKRLGNREPHLLSAPAILAENHPNPNNFTQLVRATCTFENGKIAVASNGLNMSGSVTSLSGADALIVLPPTSTGYVQGDAVDILLLSEGKGQKESLFFRRDKNE